MPRVFPFEIPENAWKVEDADEEIFLLYSQLQASGAVSNETLDLGGLGFVDSRKGEILVRIDVIAPAPASEVPASPRDLPTSRASKREKAALKKANKAARVNEPLEIQLFQDMSALRSRKGDTGSVLWRASVQLARLLLTQQRFPPDCPFLPVAALSSCHVLELGSGTGLLSIVLTPFVAHYTTTDLPALLPLIRKNQKHNLSPSDLTKVFIDDLDWIQLHNTPISSRHAAFPIRSLVANPVLQSPMRTEQKGTHRKASSSAPGPAASPSERYIDLILVVDCIYNPSLIAPLLSTIDHFAGPSPRTPISSEFESDHDSGGSGSAAVFVVLELRASEVAREFLEGWLALPSKWEIWSVPLLDARFAMWVGRSTAGAMD